jgi:hypothetical protein
MLPLEAARVGHIGAIRQMSLGWAATAGAFCISAVIAQISIAVAGSSSVDELIFSALIWSLVAPPFGLFILFSRAQRRDLIGRVSAAMRRGGA